MIVATLDLGAPSHPWLLPVTGQTMGQVMVDGVETFVYPRGSIVRQQSVTFRVRAWQAIGGATAGTQAAAKYLVKQLEEIAGNRDLQPTYIQWSATADPAASYNAVDSHDGWYLLNGVEPNYANFIVSGIVLVRMSVTHVGAPAPRVHAMSYIGGAITSNLTGAATNLIALPVGSTASEISANRTGGEGAFPTVLSPAASPEPFVLSSTISQIFQGGVHVYDSIS